MAIISASRRTDIPTYFSDWFLNRLEEGNLLIRNPYNKDQVSIIPLNKECIECIVFWTKNPIPMLQKGNIDRLNMIGIPYYFQFTLTGYERDIEENLPHKLNLINSFKKLHDKGNGHIIWRYDPIVFTNKYTPEWHIGCFERIARRLCGYTNKCVISFVDIYSAIQSQIKSIGVYQIRQDELINFCKSLVSIATCYNMKIGTCAEIVNLEECGIVHNKCIDPDYIEEIIGMPIKNRKDKAQRKECGCIESIDIGAYSTCKNGCKYCYACKDKIDLEKNFAKYDPSSSLLCDSLQGFETVTQRKLTSMIDYKTMEKLSQTTLNL